MSNNKSKYVKLTHLEHILTRPDSYIGSVVSDEEDMYIVENNDLTDINIIKKKIKYNPGFLKIYDEIITNASDHSIRTGEVKIIKINIDDKKIVVQNDGPTVPIEIHPDEKVYIPQMLWMDLLTGENYNDNEVREVAGKNGYGSKLCNIYSKKFIIECCDGKLKYVQTAKNNMTSIGEPLITKVEKGTKSYTKVTYYPDYSRFDFGDIITDDLRSLMYKRALDLAVYIPNVRVTIDSKTIPIKKISDYMLMHLPDGSDLFHEKLDNGWEIGIAKSDQHGFESNSIVNGLSTYRGGTHINFISLMVAKLISDKIKKKVTWMDVKNKLHIFLICKIPNPSFDTQTKVNLTTKMTADIHKNSKISELMIKKIMKSDIVLSILEEFEMKEKLQLKRMGGGKRSKVNLPKLQDANRAGTRDSSKCHLFLCEGDCLHEDIEILVLRDTKKLNIKIKDVEIDDVVITHNSNLHVITSVSKKIKKSCKIYLSNDEILICSSSHKWFVYDTEKDDFIFIETKDIDKDNHKMIINKNVKFESFVKINKINVVKNDKYDVCLETEVGEILSTHSHKFSVIDKSNYGITMVECKDLDIENHLIVNYISL